MLPSSSLKEAAADERRPYKRCEISIVLAITTKFIFLSLSSEWKTFSHHRMKAAYFF